MWGSEHPEKLDLDERSKLPWRRFPAWRMQDPLGRKMGEGEGCEPRRARNVWWGDEARHQPISKSAPQKGS